MYYQRSCMVLRKQKKYLVQEANEMWVISNDAICGPMSLSSRELEGKARRGHTDFLGLQKVGLSSNRTSNLFNDSKTSIGSLSFLTQYHIVQIIADAFAMHTLTTPLPTSRSLRA